MIAAHIKRLYYVCDKVIVRNLRGGSRKFDVGPNPGLDNRISAFKKEGLKIENDDAEEFVEQSESNFYGVGEAYNQLENEALVGKYELRHQIVKEKYFKENMPNLLTWSEKEQIRHLATTQPEEWTPERIAESFPVTVQIVKKLLKYPWKPASEQRIARHDASAMRNWRELKEGSFKIPEDLRRHFLKFSNRTIPPLNLNSISKIEITQKNDKMGEFESIIRKCAARAKQKESKQDIQAIEASTIKSSNKVETKQDKKVLTLDELASKIKTRLESGNTVDISDQLMVKSLDSSASEITVNKLSEKIVDNSETNKKDLAEIKENDPKEINITNYPERIRIPKKAYKVGATYKVNDCYYDHDGRFLYRVIGMNATN